MGLYLFPFLYSFLACAFLLFIILTFLDRLDFGSRKSKRHLHKKNISRLGGVALILSFISVLMADSNLVFSQKYQGLAVILVLILLFGLWDDFKEVKWKTQIFFQTAVAILTFIIGIKISYITNPFGGTIDFKVPILALIFVIFWTVLFINIMNWADGVDGLSGGISLIGALTIFFLSLKPEVNQPPIGIVSAVFAGSLLAFLFFNFHPAKIFAGTSGSMFMGYILAVLAIFAGAKIATTLLIAAVPLVDAFWVIKDRMKNGRPIFRPDNRHLHYKLLELGWSQKKICIFYYAVTITIATVALNTRSIGKLVTVLLSSAIIIVFILFISRKTEKRKKYAN